MPDDHAALLQKYAATGDAEAFARIVRDYQGLVFSACLRVLGNAADAEDVSQECFLRLARQARAVNSSLGGWLHRCATTMSIDEQRRNSARRNREEVHNRMNGSANPDPAWHEMAPHVDRALDELPDELRLVLIEHFLQQRTQAEIAEQLGVSPATVSRRVDSGIEVLRKKLKKAGVMVTAGVLAALLAENSVQAAPASLGIALAKMAMAGVQPTPAAVVGSTASTMSTGSTAAAGLAAAAKIKIAAIVVAAVLAIGGGVTIIRHHSGVPFPWAAERGWKADEIARTTLEGFGGGWRNLPFEISKDEEADVKACKWLAQKIGAGSQDGVSSFQGDDVRRELEAILARRPNWFYAEFLLGQWYELNGDAVTAEGCHELAWEHAPVVIVQRFRLADGSPLAGANVQLFALECNRVKNGYLNPNLVLSFPGLRTDDDGCIYLPAYDTVFRRESAGTPAGYYATFPRLGWFKSPRKVGLLPEATVKDETEVARVICYHAEISSRGNYSVGECIGPLQPKGSFGLNEVHVNYRLLGSTPEGDRYEFQRQFTVDGKKQTEKKEIVFKDKDVIVFDDDLHRLMILAPGTPTSVGTTPPEKPAPAAILEYRVIPVAGAKPEQVIDEVIRVTARRLDAIGQRGYKIRKADPDLIAVELSQLGALSVDRIRGVLESVGSLEFRTVCSDEAMIKQANAGNVPAGYHWYPRPRASGEVLLVSDIAELTGQHIAKAAVQRNAQTREPEIAILFDEEGQRIFSKVTGENIGEQLAIILGTLRDADGRIVELGKLYSAPEIKSRIWGSAVIAGNFTQAEAEDLASVLQAGALPAKLELRNKRIQQDEQDE